MLTIDSFIATIKSMLSSAGNDIVTVQQLKKGKYNCHQNESTSKKKLCYRFVEERY